MSATEQVMAQGTDGALPRSGFIAEHGLWDSDQEEAAARVLETIERHKLRRVRIGWGRPARHRPGQDADRPRVPSQP